MVRATLRRWRRPPPMLVFMLAVMVPAAALIVASVSYLTHIQRGKMVEKAIESDYQHILKIAEKRIVERMYDTSEKASTNFPDVNRSCRTRNFSEPPIRKSSTPFFGLAKVSLIFDLNRARWQIRISKQNTRLSPPSSGIRFDVWSGDHIAMVRKNEAIEGRHVYINSEPVSQGYQNAVRDFRVLAASRLES